MTANVNDNFKKVGASTVTTLSSPGKALGATSITVGSTTNYPTDTGIIIAIRQVDTSGNQIAGTYTEWSATVTSGTSLNIVATPVYGSDQVYPAGSTTQVYIPLSSYAQNTMVDGILNEHAQNGTHKAITATSITATTGTFSSITVGTQTPTADWTAIGVVPTATTQNGQKETVLTYADTDLTSTLQPGHKLKLPRTGSVPTQATSLNGTNQYWVKTSPNKMTFTDDFVVSAWVYLTSYAGCAIAGRRDANNGWSCEINTSGQIQLAGYNGGSLGNFSRVLSYQSVPLNKWVHITAQLDMSAFTATTTTSYVMFDGINVPASVSRGGTNPTSLVQGGDLNIGAVTGALFFTGKIAHVAIYNAKVTQATIQAQYNKGYIGNETSLISAYSFNGVATDLNTTTPNDLTAQNSAGYVTDNPFSATEYAIVTAVSKPASDTLVTVFSGKYCIPSETLGATSYSTARNPFGGDWDKGKWNVVMINKTDTTTPTPVASTWYNGASLNMTVPVGSWAIGYSVNTQQSKAAAAILIGAVALSISSSSNNDSELTATYASNSTNIRDLLSQRKNVSLSTPTLYYLINKTDTASVDNIYLLGTQTPSTIFAECNYL